MGSSRRPGAAATYLFACFRGDGTVKSGRQGELRHRRAPRPGPAATKVEKCWSARRRRRAFTPVAFGGQQAGFAPHRGRLRRRGPESVPVSLSWNTPMSKPICPQRAKSPIYKRYANLAACAYRVFAELDCLAAVRH